MLGPGALISELEQQKDNIEDTLTIHEGTIQQLQLECNRLTRVLEGIEMTMISIEEGEHV